MSYDLLEEQWIPVRTASGARKFIAPWQIVDAADPPIDIDTGRPDFDCAGIQFLIGLLQTAWTPPTEDLWRKFHDLPPTQEQLRQLLQPLRGKFDLLGEGPRFMQDQSLAGIDLGAGKAASIKPLPGEKRKKSASLSLKPVAGLLIDGPGESTLNGNKDHFVKRFGNVCVSRPGAAWLLLALQTSSPSGGVGHRTSLRGGGPLTTWILGKNLWSTAWRNVLDTETWNHVPGGLPDGLEADSMPWLGPVRVSTDEGSQTQPAHCARLHHYWGMPRRLWLADLLTEGECAVLPGQSGPFVSSVNTANYGFDYKGAYQHPLTPYRLDGPGAEPAPIKGNRSALSYDQWPALILGVASDGGRSKTPALVVRRWRQLDGVPAAPVAVAGYDMDNMKPLAWCHAQMPVLSHAKDREEGMRAGAIALVGVAEYVAGQFGLAARGSAVREGDQRFKTLFQKDEAARLRDRFWSATEPGFYEVLGQLGDAIEAGHEVATDSEQVKLRKWWCSDLHSHAMRLFDEASQLLGNWEAGDVRRIAEARKWLFWNTKPDSDRMLEKVGLKTSDPDKKSKGKSAKANS